MGPGSGHGDVELRTGIVDPGLVIDTIVERLFHKGVVEIGSPEAGSVRGFRGERVDVDANVVGIDVAVFLVLEDVEFNGQDVVSGVPIVGTVEEAKALGGAGIGDGGG